MTTLEHLKRWIERERPDWLIQLNLRELTERENRMLIASDEHRDYSWPQICHLLNIN